MNCRKLSEQPPATKALVYKTSLTNCFGKPFTIPYSFDIAPYISSLQNAIINEGYVAKLEDVLVMNSATRALVRKAMQAWEAVANVKFVEDKSPDVLVFSYHATGRRGTETNGFAKVPGQARRYLGINTYLDQQLNSPFAIHVVLHELGHIAGLDHPWVSQLLKYPFQNATTFSIMNYNTEATLEKQLFTLPVEPNTPMPADMRAMQFIFGANTSTNTGNQTYYLRDYAPSNRLTIFDKVDYTTISSLPWDASGQDTFSAEGLTDNVVMNIRSGGVSKVRHAYTATPFMALENVVSGNGGNAIVLNPLDNHVNITRSRLSLLFFAPPNTGKDTVIGFKPNVDKIFLEQSTTNTRLSWALSLDASSTPICNTTLLKFNDNNFVRIIGVHPAELMQSISTCQAYSSKASGITQANSYMRELVMAHQRQDAISTLELLSRLAKMTSGAVALSGGAVILHIVLEKNLLLVEQKALSNLVASCLPLVLTGEFKSTGITVATQLMFDESSALHFTAGIMLGSIAMQSSSVTDFAINLAQTAMVAAAGYLTSKFTFWAYDATFNDPAPSVQPAPAPAKQ